MSDYKQYTVEFDDALLDLEGWKRPRHYGSKLTAAKINKYTTGDITYGKTPVLERKTNAIYIANTIIDAGSGSSQPEPYTTIKKHCYVGIDKMLLINDDDDSITTIEGKGVGDDIIGNTDFLGFNRYLTSDFPTGAKFQIKILDESKQTNIKPGGYYVKMNKGYLYPCFRYNQADDNINYDERNGIFLYNHGLRNENKYVGRVIQNNNVISGSASSGSLRFRYANFYGDQTTDFKLSGSTPSFASSSILQNQFTEQYYSSSYGFINDPFPGVGAGSTQAEQYAGSGIGSASAFLSVNTLNFLRENNADPNIDPVDKTELHLTLFEGTKDFAPGFNDERSISTFEVDANQEAASLGDSCNAGLPLINELVLKGSRIPNGDHRFTPSIPTHRDTVWSVSFTTSSGAGCNTLCNLSTFDNISVYVQGGNAGQVGFYNQTGPSDGALFELGSNFVVNTLGEMPLPPEAFYSGSMSYELSWLKKDHVIITNINKNLELPDGIGNKGMVLIPNDLDPKIKKNLDYYLNKAGLTTTKINKAPISTKRFR